MQHQITARCREVRAIGRETTVVTTWPTTNTVHPDTWRVLEGHFADWSARLLTTLRAACGEIAPDAEAMIITVVCALDDQHRPHTARVELGTDAPTTLEQQAHLVTAVRRCSSPVVEHVYYGADTTSSATKVGIS